MRPGGSPPRLGRTPAPGTWADVDPDGTVHLHPPVPGVGQGSHTVLAHLVLEELGATSTAWSPIRRTPPAASRSAGCPRSGAARRPWTSPLAGPVRRCARGGAGPRRCGPRAGTGWWAPPRPGWTCPPRPRVPRCSPPTCTCPACCTARSPPRRVPAPSLGVLDPTWTGGSTAGEEDVRRAVTVGPEGGHVLQVRGDPDAALAAGRRLTAEYRTPMVAADPPEPPVAVADVTPSVVTVYASTQDPACCAPGSPGCCAAGPPACGSSSPTWAAPSGASPATSGTRRPTRPGCRRRPGVRCACPGPGRRSCSTGPGARRPTTSWTRPSARRPAPVAAALANAALALTGHRLRGLPLRLPGGIGGWVPPEARSPDA